MGKFLAYMTWEQAKEAFKTTKLVLVPTGSVEQHGPHMPLGTDYLIADHLAKLVGDTVDAIITPVIPIGYAMYHTDFPGTLSTTASALAPYYQGFIDCLVRYGATHILFINGHGGNGGALTTVCRNLRERGITAAYTQWWDIAGGLSKEWAMIGHGDIVEASMMLALAPEAVRLERAAVPVNKKLAPNTQILDGSAAKFKDGVVRFGLRTADTSDTGDMLEIGHSNDADYALSPAKATAENGRRIFAAVAQYLADFTEEFKQITFQPIK